MILKDSVAIVTGARVGIGRALAMGFAGEGAHIVINDIQEEGGAKEVIAHIRNMGRKALYMQGDVALEEDVKRVVSATLGTFGRIDILVNNAGLRTIAYLGVEIVLS